MESRPLDFSRISEPAVPETGRREIKEEDYLLKKMDRDNKMDATIHVCRRALLVVSFFIIIVIILIRVFILVAPPHWEWLSSGQTAKLDEFFVHGTIGAIVAGYLGKYFKEK